MDYEYTPYNQSQTGKWQEGSNPNKWLIWIDGKREHDLLQFHLSLGRKRI